MYAKLLDIVRRLNRAQIELDKARDKRLSMDMKQTTRAQRARAVERIGIASWERDKLHDELRCELVNMGLSDPSKLDCYLPRRVEMVGGQCLTYSPPVPDCIKQLVKEIIGQKVL